MTTELQRTALFSKHEALGAKMVPFSGYLMPVQYSGIVDEHKTVRQQVGLFDVSHMGEVTFRGPAALEAANHIVTNDLCRLNDGQACYTMMCRPDGGILDDLIVYRHSSEHLMICVNAGNRQKDFEWMQAHAQGQCTVVDESDEYAQIAVQGPMAPALVNRLQNQQGPLPARYHFETTKLAGRSVLLARTGYTGEDGFELYLPAHEAASLWDALLDQGADLGVKPAGLGARDSLRLEMRYPLYGQDIDESTDPYKAGLGWTVKLTKDSFIAKAALSQIREQGPGQKLVGFIVKGRGIARHGYPILDAAGVQEIGRVSSGTMGPSVGRAIGMGYVPKPLSQPGTDLQVQIRGKTVPIEVVKTPFYRGSPQT